MKLHGSPFSNQTCCHFRSCPTSRHILLSTITSLLLGLSALLCTNQVKGQHSNDLVVLADRVGDQIDVYERSYFHLFPRVDDFESARIYRVNDSTYQAIITQTSSTTVNRALTKEEFHEIGNYIARYERVYNDTPEVEWGYLIKHVQPNSSPFQRGVPVRVTLLDRTEIEGRLVFINEQGLLISEDIKPNEPEEMAANVRFIQPEALYRIRQLGSLIEKAFAEFDIFFAGEPDIYFKYTAPILNSYAFYGEAPPPELSRLMPPQHAETPDAIEPTPQRDGRSLRDVIFEQLHVRFYFADIPSARNDQEVEVLAFLYTEDEFERPLSTIMFQEPYLVIGVDVHAASRLKIGASVQFSRSPSQQPDFIEQDLEEEGRERVIALIGLRLSPATVEVGGNQFIGRISYELIPADRVVRVYPQLTFRNFDLSVGAGASYWRQMSATTLKSASVTEGFERWFTYTRNYRDRRNLYGLYAEIEANLYISRHLSLGLHVHQFIYPDFRVEDRALADIGIYEVGKSLTGVHHTLSIRSVKGVVAIHF